MATVGKVFADCIVAANGALYPDDLNEPVIQRIVEYTNMAGHKAYGITFTGEDQEIYMHASEYIIDPKIYFERK